MKLYCLGTGGYHPSEHRHTACYYLPELQLVLDAGTGMFRLPNQLKTQQTGALDIFITHAHLDHIIGLTYLLALDSSTVQGVTVHADPAKIKAIKSHLFADLLFPVLPAITFQPLAEPVELGSWRITWFDLRHPGGSVGFRLDGPKQSLAYVTDTTANKQAAYIEPIRDVDLLIHECHFTDEQQASAELTGHSCVSAVAEVAQACGTQQLLLVHVNPHLADDEALLATARRGFPNTQLATDGLVFEV